MRQPISNRAPVSRAGGYPLISARSYPTIGIELPISALGLVERRGGHLMMAMTRATRTKQASVVHTRL
jgi:hypothetical protein